MCSGSNVHNCTGGSELYGYYATIQGQKVAQACDDSVGSCANTTYDDLNRLTAYTPVAGNQNFYTYSYDRYGNRWQQTPTNGGASANFSFDKTTNHLAGYSYDAAGNLLNDGYHSYTYDAEGNLLQVDGGATASYIYDAFNRRVRKAAGSTARGYVFDLTGRRVSIWDYSSGNQIQGQVYWGGLPIAFYKGNQAFFQHQDWLGSERIETSASGGVANRVGELVFGDHSNLGSGLDDYQFAGMDTDLETDSHHAQYRQYDSIAGRWMSPDPYDGSYDPSNPQSFNRYSYVMNNPLSLTDPTGQFTNGSYCGDSCPDDGSGFVNLFVDIGQALASLFGFGGPSFHGSLHPRPAGTGNAQWDGNFGESLGISTKIPTGRWGIAQALGLPDAGCEFGACGAGPMGFTDYNQAQTSSQLQVAYNEITLGRLAGLLNIKNHSCGECKYDYGWNSHSGDTWNVCGHILNADQMGNFMAGYQSGVYDSYYFWTTGAIWAQGSVDAAGILYHLTGRTKATNDPLDRTGMPDILRGQRYARHGCSAGW